MNVITIETVKHYDKTLDKTSFSISNNFFFEHILTLNLIMEKGRHQSLQRLPGCPMDPCCHPLLCNL